LNCIKCYGRYKRKKFKKIQSAKSNIVISELRIEKSIISLLRLKLELSTNSILEISIWKSSLHFLGTLLNRWKNSSKFTIPIKIYLLWLTRCSFLLGSYRGLQICMEREKVKFLLNNSYVVFLLLEIPVLIQFYTGASSFSNWLLIFTCKFYAAIFFGLKTTKPN
jgi:hypothetical protein